MRTNKIKSTTTFTLIFLLLIIATSFCHQIDFVEHMFGATNINSITGNGQLTAAFSKEGILTVLRFPSATHFNHINYKTAIIPSNSEHHARELPRLGAARSMGSFGAIYYEEENEKGFSELYGEGWKHNQYYLSDESPVIVTEYKNAQLNIHITSHFFVHPEMNLLVEHFSIEKGSALKKLKFYFYENLSPSKNKKEFSPLSDWKNEERNDFAAYYDLKNNSIVHFVPKEKKSFIPSDGKDNFVDFIHGNYGNGYYFSIAGDFTPSSFQIGNDEETECKKGKMYKIPSALLEAERGELSKSTYAFCQVNAVMEREIQSKDESFTIFISAAENMHDATKLIGEARKEGFFVLEREAEKYWGKWLSKAKLPSAPDSVVKIAKRSLITLKIYQDKEKGSIVASASTQPPYFLDWPRDGSFANYALEIAGYADMVTKHNLFYVSVQRKAKKSALVREGLAGSFAMNYYSDGMEGGPIAFEIDETALPVWSLAEHIKFLQGGKENYARMVYPAIKKAVEVLYDCWDEGKKLPCPASVDDDPNLTQSMHSAFSVYLGMKEGLEIAKMMKDMEVIKKWGKRLEELKKGILKNYYHQDKNYFSGGEGNSFDTYGGVIYPEPIFPIDDDKIKGHADYLYENLLTFLNPKSGGTFCYIEHLFCALGIAWRKEPEKLNKLKQLFERFSKETPTPETHHFGEVFAAVDADGDGILDSFENRVGIPIIGGASLYYLASMFIYNP